MGIFSSKPYYKNDIDPKIIDRFVSEMKKDEVLIKGWRKLARELGISVDQISVMNQMELNGRNPEDILRSIVVHWSSGTDEANVHRFCESLRNVDFVNVAEKIERRKNKMDGRRIQHDIGRDGTDFLGRTDELKAMEILYQDFKSPVFIHGPAGYGKTELAKKFARKFVKESNINVLLLHGESGFKLEDGIKQACEEAMNGKISNQKEIWDCVPGLAELSGGIIIIIDNVDRENKSFNTLLRSLKKIPSCFIIVTTRDLNAVRRYEEQQVQLEVFDANTSVQLIKNRLPKEKDPLVTMLRVELQDWPIALVHAISYINKFKLHSKWGKSYDIKHYLDILKNEPASILDPDGDEREITLSKTLGLSLKHIDDDSNHGKVATQLLHLLAYLDPDGVPVATLEKLYFHAYPDLMPDIDQCITVLLSYSVIRADDCVLAIHRMTQKIVRLQIVKSQITENPHPMLAVLTKILLNFKNDFNSNEKFQITILWDHVLELGGKDVAKQHLDIPIAISDRLIELANFKIAYDFCKKTVIFFQNVLGDVANESTLKLEYNMARSLNYSGEVNKSFLEFSNLQEKVIRTTSDEHELCFEVQLELASLYKNLNKVDDALKEYQRIHERCKERFGRTSALTLRAKHGIGLCLMDQGKLIDSMTVLLDVLKDRKTNWGEKDPSYLRTLYYTGECQLKLGELDKSKQICIKALNLQQECNEVYHAEHDLTFKSLCLLLETLSRLGDSIDWYHTLSSSVNNDKKYLLQALKNKRVIDAFEDDKFTNVLLKTHEIMLSLMEEQFLSEEKEFLNLQNQIVVFKKRLSRFVGSSFENS